MAASSNDPSLVAKALSKALSVESRLNSLVGLPTTPIAPTVLYTGGGQVVVTASGNGTFTWTCPAGVTSAMIECWAAGAGGSGGSASVGGAGGGGGEYAQEPIFVTVPGTVYSYTVGNGGSGGPSNTAGTSGGDSFFNFGGAGISVYANGGNAGSASVGGTPGAGSTNTIHSNGGTGGGDASQSTGGCGGGGSGGSGGAGGSGTDSSSSTGTVGGAAGAGGGAAGGHGGNSGANGSNGAGVGAGGGGSGTGTTTVISKKYNANTCRSYYGADGSNPNATRQVNGTMWQGGETATGGTANGTQKFIFTFPTNPTIISDFSGATMTSATLGINNEHSWYGSGMSVQIRLWQNSGGLPPTWNGLGAPLIFDSTIGENVGKTWSIGQAIAAGFGAGTNFGIAFGPGPNAFDVNWYGYFYGAGSAHPPTLTLVGTVGTVIAAGAGIDGQVKITYTLPATATLVAAVQPTATTDASGNALAAGVTVAPVAGTVSGVVAVQPASSPAVLEVWHKITGGIGYQNSWTDNSALVGQYKLTGDNAVWIVGTFVPGTKTDNTVMFTLPAGYRPNKQICIPIGVQGSGSNLYSANVPSPFVAVGTDGTVAIFGVNLGGTTSFVHLNGLVPLDTLSS